MRVIHIPVKTEETQRLRIKFVLYCPICASNLKIKRALSETKLSNVQCPVSGPRVQQSLLRHSSAHVHSERLSEKCRIPPVTTVSEQPHMLFGGCPCSRCVAYRRSYCCVEQSETMFEHVVFRCQFLPVLVKRRPGCPDTILDFGRFLLLECNQLA